MVTCTHTINFVRSFEIETRGCKIIKLVSDILESQVTLSTQFFE